MHEAVRAATAAAATPAAAAAAAVRAYPHAKRVGQYLLGRVLGEGAFAKVREAIHCPTGEKVAVKVLDKSRVRGDAYLSRALRREAAVQRRAGPHEGLCRLLHALDSPAALYLILELCPGGDLGSHIARLGRLPEARARGHLRQLLAAAAHLHSRGVVHRDLKIENMLLDEDDNIKIIDFGLSNELATCGGGGAHEGAMLLTQCGSPAYAAPEILSQKPYGTPADVWSLGVSLFVMLTGGLPFTVEPFNIKALLNKILNNSMNPIPNHLSADAVRFTKSLLNPDPELRLSAREALTDSWLQQDPPPTRTPPSRPEPLDARVLHIMADSMGVWPAEVAAAVSANQSGALLTTYFLLCQREHRRARAEKKVNEAGFEKDDLDLKGPNAVDPGERLQPITVQPRSPSSQSDAKNEIQTVDPESVKPDRGDCENTGSHPDRDEEICGSAEEIPAAPTVIYRRMPPPARAPDRRLFNQRRMLRAAQTQAETRGQHHRADRRLAISSTLQVPPARVSPRLPEAPPLNGRPPGRLPPLSPAPHRLLPKLGIPYHGEGNDGDGGRSGGSCGGGLMTAGMTRWRLMPGRAKQGMVGNGSVPTVTFELLPPVSEAFRSKKMGGGM